MKKKLLFLISIMLLLCGQTLCVHAEEQKTVYSDGYFYYHLEDGYVSICGYFGKEETVEVPSSIIALPVSRVETGAFDKCSTVKEVILPDTIMEVQDGAFSGAQNLSSVKDSNGEEQEEYNDQNKDNTEQSISSGGDAGENGYIEPDDNNKSQAENEKNLQEIEKALNKSSDSTKTIGVNSKGNLVVIDEPGKETVIDDTQTYTKKDDGTIVNKDGNAVQVKDDNEVEVLDEEGNVIKSSFPWKIVVTIGAAIILAVTAILVYLRKKNTDSMHIPDDAGLL